MMESYEENEIGKKNVKGRKGGKEKREVGRRKRMKGDRRAGGSKTSWVVS